MSQKAPTGPQRRARPRAQKQQSGPIPVPIHLHLNCLTYNVSIKAMAGTRSGVFVLRDPTTKRNKIFSSQVGPKGEPINLPGSKNYLPNLPRRQIVEYILQEHTKYSLISLVEATQDLINILKGQINDQYQIARFWSRGMTEAHYLLYRKELEPVDAFCLSIGHRDTSCPRCRTPLKSRTWGQPVDGVQLIKGKVCPRPQCQFDLLRVPTEEEMADQRMKDLRPQRAIGVMVFKNFVYVGVHYPHPFKGTPNAREEHEKMNTLLRGTLEYLLRAHGTLTNLPVIIGGDFNHEVPFPTEFWSNTSTNLKTAFVLTPINYFKSGEHPLSFAIDRFVATRTNLECLDANIPINEYPGHLNGTMSDHLPCQAQYRLGLPPLFSDEGDRPTRFLNGHHPINRRGEEITLFEHGAYAIRIYPRNVGVPCLDPEPGVIDPSYLPLFPEMTPPDQIDVPVCGTRLA